MQRSLLVKIKDHIDRRLADQALGPAQIAAAAGVSPRYLYKVFAAERCPVSQYIKRCRLERCRRDLLDPRLGEQSIAAIAFGSGLGDLSGLQPCLQGRVRHYAARSARRNGRTFVTGIAKLPSVTSERI